MYCGFSQILINKKKPKTKAKARELSCAAGFRSKTQVKRRSSDYVSR